MKKSKKIVFAMTLLTAISGAGIFTAYADTSRGGWSFSVKEKVELSDIKPKDTSSSAWVSVEYGGGKNNFKIVAPDWLGTDIRDSRGREKIITLKLQGNVSSTLQNYANECGYSEVKLKVWRDNGETGIRGGSWQADI